MKQTTDRAANASKVPYPPASMVALAITSLEGGLNRKVVMRIPPGRVALPGSATALPLAVTDRAAAGPSFTTTVALPFLKSSTWMAALPAWRPAANFGGRAGRAQGRAGVDRGEGGRHVGCRIPAG